MDRRQRKKLDKILLNMLGRNPAEFLLVGDEEGWVHISQLHKALIEEKAFGFLTLNMLRQHFSLFRPKGLEIKGDLVRAEVSFQSEGLFKYPVKSPPQFLFFPIRERAYFFVKEKGIILTPDRQWNALCSSREKATLLGRRFTDSPMLVKVLAWEAEKSGIIFNYAGHELYLTRHDIGSHLIELPQVSEEFILRSSKPGEGAKTRKKTEDKVEKDSDHLKEKTVLYGSFFPTFESFEKIERAKRYSRKKKKGKRHKS